MKRILLIEGDTAVRGVLSDALREAGCTTLESADPWTAFETVPAWQPDLIVLDWRAQDVGYPPALIELKREPSTQNIPVVLLSARDAEEDRIGCMQIGADEYVVKPFSANEVVARINALLRRASSHQEVIETAGLRLDASSHVVTANQDFVRLRPSEFRLLYFFMTHPDNVHSRSQILNRVWHYKDNMGERAVDVHVRRLRQALGDHGHDSLIQTVRGVGYRFSARYIN